ncbi:ABC-type glutathione transport system ATPase component [Microbacterium sp. SORGH_AS 1204]|nr:ABC-type glutathione transport system ATPase component [Microbacterium sp. SORGH_AS_1204]
MMTTTTPAPATDGTLRVKDLRVTYRKRGLFTPAYTAIDGVSFELKPGRTLGLVGESGSGKSTIGRAILGLTRVAGGHISYDGRDITHLPLARRREVSTQIQVVFQDPYSSLNPSLTVGDILTEPLLALRRMTRAEADGIVRGLLDRVSLPGNAVDRYPREFSGGQRQRIAIARALAVSPRLVVCDEPTSALDLTTQAQVLDLMAELQRDLGVSYLFISHDLAVVRQVSHEVAVLNKGRIVEFGPTRTVTETPADDYTRLLLAAAPVPDPRLQQERRLARRALLAGA